MAPVVELGAELRTVERTTTKSVVITVTLSKCGVVSVRLDRSALTSTTETTVQNVPEIRHVSFALLLTKKQPERQLVDKSDRHDRFTTFAARVGQDRLLMLRVLDVLKGTDETGDH